MDKLFKQTYTQRLSMDSLSKASNLIQYIIDPVSKNLGKKLKAFLYHDVCSVDELTTNNNGIDIIAHQLELKFQGNNPIFISWASIDSWSQYSLCVSETSFCNSDETFTKHDRNWAAIIGQRLNSFKVYGYKENIATSTRSMTGRVTVYEPHLLLLHFDNGCVLGIANFYLEDDFDPKYPMGDDIWIIFNRNKIEIFIEKLLLECLNL